MTEADLVARFRSLFPAAGPVVRRWAGEDAAHIASGHEERVACVDLLLEGVHFRLDWSSARDVGYKAVTVNYSDLASCGAEPLYILLALAAPPSFLEEHLDGFYAGIRQALDRWGGAFAGGDYSRSERVFVSLTAVGTLPAQGRFWGRDGVAPGDRLYLSGSPGEAALALQRLAQNQEGPTVAQRAPDPPLPVSRYLRRAGVPVGGCCDTSDGLSTSLHLLARESGCRLIFEPDSLPLPASDDGFGLALHGGEDYGLLFSSPDPVDTEDFFAVTGIRLSWIGRAEGGSGVVDSRGNPVPEGGFDHLA